MKSLKGKKIIFGVIGVILFIAWWQATVWIKQDASLVSVERIVNALVNIIIQESFYINLLSTLKIVLIGISIAAVSGIVLSVIFDLNSAVKHAITPLIELLRNIPSITLFPILLVLYGIGDAARIFVIFWTAFPSVILSSVYGLSGISKTVIEAAEDLGANKFQIMRTIKLPLALPEILNGIRIGIGSGFVAIVVAEMLGASKGLGYMVLWATNSFKYPETYAYIIIIALVGATVNGIMSVVIKKCKRSVL